MSTKKRTERVGVAIDGCVNIDSLDPGCIFHQMVSTLEVVFFDGFVELGFKSPNL
jgi:hypothetical protein